MYVVISGGREIRIFELSKYPDTHIQNWIKFLCWFAELFELSGFINLFFFLYMTDSYF